MWWIDSRARYPWLSWGSITRRTVPPSPLTAWYIRSDCTGKVPELLSTTPWVSNSGSLIFSACMKADIRKYTSGASQKLRRSYWKPKGVRLRLKAPLRAMPAAKSSEWASMLAVMKAP